MLTTKQIAFVDARARGMNATEAAKAAGYGRNHTSSKSMGSRLMQHPAVRAALAARLASGEALEPAAPDDPEIAGPLEQKKILTAIARSEAVTAEIRIKAVATLAKLTAPKPVVSSPAPTATANVVVVVDNGRGPLRSE